MTNRGIDGSLSGAKTLTKCGQTLPFPGIQERGEILEGRQTSEESGRRSVISVGLRRVRGPGDTPMTLRERLVASLSPRPRGRTTRQRNNPTPPEPRKSRHAVTWRGNTKERDTNTLATKVTMTGRESAFAVDRRKIASIPIRVKCLGIPSVCPPKVQERTCWFYLAHNAVNPVGMPSVA